MNINTILLLAILALSIQGREGIDLLKTQMNQIIKENQVLKTQLTDLIVPNPKTAPN